MHEPPEIPQKAICTSVSLKRRCACGRPFLSSPIGDSNSARFVWSF